ncbi:hypothetical protein NDU88_003667 [Pleurodeles waltl]|uniref:Uncharacterized protein n=1 Tax=Pleurodeles waltl TaxID=8319 RepID=A0AAV7W5Q4_PLEWA|nr:hypothetical protein NDU88_003667 [Pleurodeles waltl]
MRRRARPAPGLQERGLFGSGGPPCAAVSAQEKAMCSRWSEVRGGAAWGGLWWSNRATAPVTLWARASGGLWPGGVACRSEACLALEEAGSAAALRGQGPSGQRCRWSAGAPGNWWPGGPPTWWGTQPWILWSGGLAMGLLAVDPCWRSPMVIVAGRAGPGRAFWAFRRK